MSTVADIRSRELRRFGISRKTAAFHKSNMTRRLGIRGTAELTK
jgi:DNA-binding CsgD family transcriptional regulator